MCDWDSEGLVKLDCQIKHDHYTPKTHQKRALRENYFPFVFNGLGALSAIIYYFLLHFTMRSLYNYPVNDTNEKTLTLFDNAGKRIGSARRVQPTPIH